MGQEDCGGCVVADRRRGIDQGVYEFVGSLLELGFKGGTVEVHGVEDYEAEDWREQRRMREVALLEW